MQFNPAFGYYQVQVNQQNPTKNGNPINSSKRQPITLNLGQVNYSNVLVSQGKDSYIFQVAYPTSITTVSVGASPTTGASTFYQYQWTSTQTSDQFGNATSTQYQLPGTSQGTLSLPNNLVLTYCNFVSSNPLVEQISKSANFPISTTTGTNAGGLTASVDKTFLVPTALNYQNQNSSATQYVAPIITFSTTTASFAFFWLSNSLTATQQTNYKSIPPILQAIPIPQTNPPQYPINPLPPSPGQFGPNTSSSTKTNAFPTGTDDTTNQQFASVVSYFSNTPKANLLSQTVLLPYVDSTGTIQGGLFQILMASPFPYDTYINNKIYNSKIPNNNLAYVGYHLVYYRVVASQSELGPNSFTFPNTAYAPQSTKVFMYDIYNSPCTYSINSANCYYMNNNEFTNTDWIETFAPGASPSLEESITYQNQTWTYAGFLPLTYSAQTSTNSSIGMQNFEQTFASGQIVIGTYSGTSQQTYFDQLPQGF